MANKNDNLNRKIIMELLFLGTGTSTGVPQIGCKCRVCISPDARDNRLRASVLITDGNTRILIDCGPDLRQQLINNKIDYLSGILLTHEHYDHVGGLDDVRPLGETQLYAEKKVLGIIKRNMPYCFAENSYPGVPKIQLNEITENRFFVKNQAIQPVRIMHAALPILGFRIGKIAYLTDVKTIKDKSFELLKDLDVLVINALRASKHISHLSVEEALQMAKRIAAKQTYFTHISHDMGLHEEVDKQFPDNIHLSYDGLKLIV